ncbi:MAG TPA: hypothetical protein VNO79_16860 [Actinomycetota bacterium]|nr:hypothetical protein [Actinomycetota bacterium]
MGTVAASQAARRSRVSRRWSDLLLEAAIVVAAVGIPAGLVFLARYQPLSTWSGFSLVSEPARFVVETAPPGGGQPFRVYRVDYAEGETVRLGFTLTNEGSIPVRITAVGVDAPLRSGFRLVGVALGRSDGSGLPFAPFTLEPGASQSVVTTWRFEGSCPPGRAEPPPFTTELSQIGVEFRVLWSRHRVQLPLPYQLQVDQGDCPVR